MFLLLLRTTGEKVDTRMGIELSPQQAIYDILKGYHQGCMTRKEASMYIKNVLMNIPPHPSTEEGINS